MQQSGRQVTGLALAVSAAFSFGVGSPFAKSLLESGWSSSAVVLARCLGVLVALAVPAALALRGRWGVLRRNAGVAAAYGGFAVVGAQLCYYSAIRFMPVGAALMIEYLAPILLVGVAWARTRRRPGGLVLAGSALAVLGLLLVVDLGGARTEAAGPLLALVAAGGAAVYYTLSARIDPELPTSALLAAAMLVGSVLLGLLALVGLAPLAVTAADVRLLGGTAPWWVPLAVVVGISTLAAYLLGIAGSARLGSRAASFLGLLEVLFAVLSSWALLGDLPMPVQLAGGALILGGVVLVQAQHDDGRNPPAPRPSRTEHRVRRARRTRSRRTAAIRGAAGRRPYRRST